MQTTNTIRLHTSADGDDFDQGAPPTLLAGQDPTKVENFEQMYKIAIRNSIFKPRTEQDRTFVRLASKKFPFFRELVEKVKRDKKKTIGLDARNHEETDMTRMVDALVEARFLTDKDFNEVARMYWKSNATLTGEPIRF